MCLARDNHLLGKQISTQKPDKDRGECNEDRDAERQISNAEEDL
jgi:hypothetical protein